jgi:hypothetical protein
MDAPALDVPYRVQPPYLRVSSLTKCGYYTNEVADDHEPRLDKHYPSNIGRLRQVKQHHDPQNMLSRLGIRRTHVHI